MPTTEEEMLIMRMRAVLTDIAVEELRVRLQDLPDDPCSASTLRSALATIRLRIERFERGE